VATMQRRAFSAPAEHVRVIPAALGGSSGVAGTLALAQALIGG